MAVRLVVAITDSDWFDHLRAQSTLDEVNFWAPSPTNFRALRPGELFLFKLHAPRNFVVGGGIFAYATVLPTSLAWESFGEGNGATSLLEMRRRISRYRSRSGDDIADFSIGCRILTQPFFLDERDWIPVSDIWPKSTVALKTYSTDEAAGKWLWEAVQDRSQWHSLIGFGEADSQYGEPYLVRPRLGQGAFRVLVTDNYGRRCAVSKERTLPALDAAHIRPFSEGGTHEARNGILLRKDIHSLFDAGYVTVTPRCRFEVSRRIREEFENGRHYYELHGQTLSLPDDRMHRPEAALLRWHNENKFLT